MSEQLLRDLSQLWLVQSGPIESFNGVSGERSEVSQIPDGQSNVFLAREKSRSQHLLHGIGRHRQRQILQGNDWDVNRWVVTGPPMPDTSGVRRHAPQGLAVRTPRASNGLL